MEFVLVKPGNAMWKCNPRLTVTTEIMDLWMSCESTRFLAVTEAKPTDAVV
jgi:hypothetical protein